MGSSRNWASAISRLACAHEPFIPSATRGDQPWWEPGGNPTIQHFAAVRPPGKWNSRRPAAASEFLIGDQAGNDPRRRPPNPSIRGLLSRSCSASSAKEESPNPRTRPRLTVPRCRDLNRR